MSEQGKADMEEELEKLKQEKLDLEQQASTPSHNLGYHYSVALQ